MSRRLIATAIFALAVVVPTAKTVLLAQSSAALTPDKGRLRILQDGNQVGTEEFEIAASGGSWIARSETTLRIQGSEIRSTGQLRLSADGTPIHYDWTAQTPQKASGTVDFKSGTAKTAVVMGNKDPVQQDFTFPSSRVAILDNNLYDQYSILALLYDWNAKGSQTLPVFIPQDTTPGTITLEALGQEKIKGAEAVGLRVRSADLEIEFYLDAKHHLLRLEVPAAKVNVVRE